MLVQPININRKALLDTIAFSEGTSTVVGSDRGYNVLVGGTLFNSYTDHPRQLVWIARINNYSDAAGRYQILARYYNVYKEQLHLPDFSPASQDAIALQMMGEVGAAKNIDAGLFSAAILGCGRRWASLPGSQYGQTIRTFEQLKEVYVNAGGTFNVVNS